MEIAAERPPNAVKYLVLGSLAVIVLAVVAILAIEFNLESPETSPAGTAPLSKSPTETAYCNQDKGKAELCDSSKDCSNGSDETNCLMRFGMPCREFRCSANTKEYQCLPLTTVCDGKKDCLDGSDETNCDACDRNEYNCPNSPIQNSSKACIDHNYICDSVPDCPGGTDEDNCVMWIWWSPWCRRQIRDAEPCFLYRTRYCQHARGRIIKDSAECIKHGLGYATNNIDDIILFCSNMTGGYEVELCPPHKALQSTTPTSLGLKASALTDRNESHMRRISIEQTGDENEHASQDKETTKQTGQGTVISTHIYSIIVGCSALAFCFIVWFSAYCIARRHQYRTYYVAKHEKKSSIAAKSNSDTSEEDVFPEAQQRVSTSSAV